MGCIISTKWPNRINAHERTRLKTKTCIKRDDVLLLYRRVVWRERTQVARDDVGQANSARACYTATRTITKTSERAKWRYAHLGQPHCGACAYNARSFTVRVANLPPACSSPLSSSSIYNITYWPPTKK